MQIKRREFLKQSAVGMGGMLIGASLAQGAESKPVFHDPYETVPLGKSGLKVSRLCLGTGVHGFNRSSNHTRMGRKKFEEIIQGAHERGVRLFDLADLYGSHPYLVPALKGIARDKYAIVTKIWFQQGGLPESERPGADVVVARFLKEIGTDYLDLVLLHCVTSGKWPEQLRRQMDSLASLKQKGTIRALGVSCHSIPALEAAAKEPWVDSVHARINPYGLSMDGPPDEVAPVLQKLRAAGKGVVGMKIIGEGKLSGDDAKRDASVRYALGLGCVDVLNVGFESVGQIDDLAARVRKVARA